MLPLQVGPRNTRQVNLSYVYTLQLQGNVQLRNVCNAHGSVPHISAVKANFNFSGVFTVMKHILNTFHSNTASLPIKTHFIATF